MFIYYNIYISYICGTMTQYKTINIDVDIHQEIKIIVKKKKFYYRSTSEFVHSALRSRLLELRKLQLLEQGRKNDS